MAYRPIQIPAKLPANVTAFVRDSVDPLLADVHAMLRLPISDDVGLRAGCTFSAALVLLATVDGIAQVIYEHPKREIGPRFRAILEQHYPWSEEPKTADAVVGSDAAETLYSTYRDPLAHRLGVVRGDSIGEVKILKGALSEDRLEQIEQSRTSLPEWSGKPTLCRSIENGREVRRRLLKRFYWGIRTMAENVLQNAADASGEMNAVVVRPTHSQIVGSATSHVTPITRISSGST